MRLLIFCVLGVGLLSLSTISKASESQIWFSSGHVYGGSKSDSICDRKDRCIKADTRIRFPFDVQWVHNNAYLEFGWFNARKEETSYTHFGGGVGWAPFPTAAKYLVLYLGIQFGEAATHSDKELRFKVMPVFQKGNWRIGWAHVSNARGFANTSAARNHPIEWITLGYCASGCR